MIDDTTINGIPLDVIRAGARAAYVESAKDAVGGAENCLPYESLTPEMHASFERLSLGVLLAAGVRVKLSAALAPSAREGSVDHSLQELMGSDRTTTARAAANIVDTLRDLIDEVKGARAHIVDRIEREGELMRDHLDGLKSP